MALSNSEYNLIMREYEERRLNTRRLQESRTAEIYEKIPRIKEIQDEISAVSLKNARNRIAGRTEGDNYNKEQLHEKIGKLIEEKNKLLSANGYSREYLAPQYVCSDCMDTGYINSEKCHCLKAKITERLYARSNLKEVLEKENFSTFNINLYSDDKVDSSAQVGALTNIKNVLEKCKNYADNFGDTCENFLIYGETGVGKTFLTNCIAKTVMDKSYSVIYMSAVHAFDVLAREQFGKDGGDNGTSAKDFNECDLLIIDDLGTELINSFTTSALFNIINERILMKKPVIISTNLSLGEIRDMYSERIFSRIASNYKMIKIFGEDLRIVKSLGLTNS